MNEQEVQILGTKTDIGISIKDDKKSLISLPERNI